MWIEQKKSLWEKKEAICIRKQHIRIHKWTYRKDCKDLWRKNHEGAFFLLKKGNLWMKIVSKFMDYFCKFLCM
jgi:hypothetical protein